MTDESKYTELHQVYSQLVNRHQRLKERANDAKDESDPIHPPEEIRAEADGVLHALQKIETLLNQWDAELDGENL